MTKRTKTHEDLEHRLVEIEDDASACRQQHDKHRHADYIAARAQSILDLAEEIRAAMRNGDHHAAALECIQLGRECLDLSFTAKYGEVVERALLAKARRAAAQRKYDPERTRRVFRKIAAAKPEAGLGEIYRSAAAKLGMSDRTVMRHVNAASEGE